MNPSIRRKSPRFSSNSDQFTINSNELALSLHVIDPVPLDFINPNPYSSLSSPIRRSSPRNTANKYKSSNYLDPHPIRPALRPNEGIPSLPPRFVSPGTDNRAIVLSGSKGFLGKRKAGVCDLSGGKSLRRSKRLNLGEFKVLALTEPVEVMDGCLRSRNVAIHVEDMKTPVRSGSDLGGSGSSVFSERCLRSRKISFVVGGGDEGVEKKNAWGEVASTSEKCLRSRRTGVSVTGGEEGIAKKSPLGESDVKNHRSMRGEVKSSISDVTIGKCLRSGKITTPVVGFENGEKKSALRHSRNYKGVDVKTDTIGLVAISEKCSTSREIIVFVGDGRVEIKDQTFGGVVTSETCSGSRGITTLVAVDEHAETKLGLINWPCKDNLGTAVTPLMNDMSGLNVTSEKRLRSGKILTTNHNEIISSLVELTDKETIRKPTNSITSASSEKKPEKRKIVASFFGEPVPEEEARERWSWRYELKGQRRAGQGWILNADEEDEVILNVECHYGQANVNGCIFSIGDCAFIRGDGKKKHVGRILEFFKTTDGEDFFRVQWFYKAEDTVMKHMASFHDKKRLFISTFMNDNPLDCIVSIVNVIEVGRVVGLQSDSIQPSGFYYDMEYCVEYSTFRTLQTDNCVLNRDLSTLNYPDSFCTTSITPSYEYLSGYVPHKAELALLDLYSGCGGMSTGLCLGAKLSNVNLLTRWAVDYNKVACESFKLNHPETQVRNMAAEDFLELLKEWEKLCRSYAFNDAEGPLQSRPEDTDECNTSTNSPSDVKMSRGEFEVESFVDISYGNVGKSGKCGLKFKVHWKGYDSSEDTWEPIEGLSNCQGHLKDFVRSGSKSKILPMPGEVDVICGGPPCQGISGYNRFRHVEDPLTDERNRQIIIFMDIVKFLKPRYVLMENVADLLRFDKASLGRYALSRLVHMKYQARLGTMAAGCYGVPQFRLRVFLWGALPCEKLPQFPLPTHDVVVRFWPSPEFEQNTVGYDEGQPRELEETLVLRDAISDLPPVTSHEKCEEMTYEMHAETEFQKYIRLTKHEMMGFASQDVVETENSVLSDHRPYTLSEDDYLRVCLIPRRKGANFRDFPGVLVDKDNKVFRDPTTEPIMLPSGKPLVPDYVFTFEKGKSKKSFARLWWDETVSTVVTFPSCHNQAALHPEQDRVLTLREYARLQGFPDYYRFCGTVKERYCQVGNAVAVPVAKALGYTLGMAIRKLGGEKPVMILPPKFSTRIPEKS